MNKETKCTCERPDDNTCNYCEQQSSIQILKEAAENFYREYPTNPLDKPEWHYNRDVDCFKKRKAFINGAKYMAERMYSEEDLKEAFKSCYTPFGFDRIGDLEQDFNKWFEQFKKK